jgi:methanogenic corrinoid protein MtbC1
MVEREGLLTPRQVARAIGVSEASVKRWCDRGLIETSRTEGGHRRLAVESVVAFLKEAGHPVIQPELLGLPSTTGHSERMLVRARQQFVSALGDGLEDVGLQVVLDLREAGHSVSAIADAVIVAALAELVGDAPEDAFKRHRGDEIGLRVVNALRADLAEPDASAPMALVAAVDGDPSTLPVALAELVLREAGWNAVSLGSLLPFATLKKAIGKHKPRLLFLYVPLVRDEEQIAREFAALEEVAAKRKTKVVVSGEGVAKADLRTRLRADAYCPTFADLERAARQWLR